MLRKVTPIAITACLLIMVAAVAVPYPQEEKKYKDRAEYDVLSKVYAEADPTKKLALLDEWTEKYAETDWHVERTQFYLDSYRKTNQSEKAVATAHELLKKIPGDFTSNYTITLLSPYLGKSDADTLSAATNASKDLLAGMNKQFATKPENVTQEAWDDARKQAETSAHKTVGWSAMQSKDNVAAEKSFTEALKLDPTQAQISYWLGDVVMKQKDVKKNDLAMFSFARAAAYDGPNAMPPEGRQQVADYVKNLLKGYAGDTGLTEYWPRLEAMAKASAFPTEDLGFKSKEELKYEADKKAREDNPLLYKYIDLKAALSGADGDTIWGELRGKLTPKMALYVISAAPAARPSTINLSSKPGGEVEVVLTLENRRRDPVGTGRKLTIDGVAMSLTKAPFKLVLNDGHTF